MGSASQSAAAKGALVHAFGAVLKEGIHTDWEHADRIKKLVKYPTARTEAGKRVFLEDYVKDMASGQKDIYYIVAASAYTGRRIE